MLAHWLPTSGAISRCASARSSTSTMAARVKHRRRDDQQRRIDGEREPERREGIDVDAVERFGDGTVVAVRRVVLDQRRVQIQVVRHHGRAEDAGREPDHPGVAQQFLRRRKSGERFVPDRPGQREFDHEAKADEKDQRGDEHLQRTLAAALQREHREGADRRHQHARRQRYAEQQLQRDRTADHLRDVARDDRNLAGDPEKHGRAAAEALAAQAREIAPRHDAHARRHPLQQHAHQARDQHDTEQLIAVFRAAAERRRPVAGVHVADRDERARADEREPASARRAFRQKRAAVVARLAFGRLALGGARRECGRRGVHRDPGLE